MTGTKRITLWAALLLAGAMTAGAAYADGGWAERVQIIYDKTTNSVSREKVRVWDPEPGKGLEFTWEPDADAQNSYGADGTVTGKGKLTWRIRGSASYDPKSVYSVYRGDLADGRPHGEGRLESRSGEIYDGTFKHGVRDGQGMLVSNDGSRYEGAFRDGQPSGDGRLALNTGEIYVGAFAAGKRHGHGRTTLPGGTSYDSAWSMGKELGNQRDMVADATLGGLLKAQSGGGAAGKVEIGIAIDQRMTQESDMRYVALVQDQDIAVFPEDEKMNEAWRGDGLVSVYDYAGGMDWDNVPAFIDVDMHTTDGSRVKLDSMELQVADSQAYRKPMLTLEGHVGCVGFRPSFTVKNHGWGDAKNVSLSVQFTGQEEGGPASRAFPVSVADFSDGADVMIDGALQSAGVATGKLADQRFSCQSRDSLNVCRSQVFNTVGFGEVADYVWGEDKLFTTAIGKIDYDWLDDAGNSYHQSEPFRIDIALATIELPEEAAECGDGFGGAPDAPRYQDVHFPLGQSNYVIDMPVRGNKNLKQYQAKLKLRADMTSYHQFSVAARFSDGSVRQSKPVSFYFFRPKPSGYVSKVEPAACYLPPEAAGCG